jgi:uncharacterized membrane protein
VRPHPWLIVVVVAALVGLVFAGVSTYDFVQHLDRQVHSLHCSFIPGMGHSTGESGCQVAMMSPYSSVFRSHVWGGIPISLPAMAVFGFIGLFAIDLMLTRRKDDPRATGFLVLASALPALMSIVMLAISLTKLGTTCKLCVCIYLASALCLVGAIGLWRRAARIGGATPVRVSTKRRERHDGDEPAWVGASKDVNESSADREPLVAGVEAPAASSGFLASAFGIGVLFVVVPVLVYLAKAPDHGRFIGTCDALVKPDDTYGIMVPVGPSRHDAGAAPAIEILDPLCPACRAFEERLTGSGYADRLDRRAVMFPLDNTCNWMVTDATHPGACAVSEAVLCAQSMSKGEANRAADVIAWAFEVQDRIRAETKKDPAAAARIVKERFPDLASCVGSPEVRSRLNKSLRWTVANNIHVLTPQLFIDGVKLCDEDVDLGLEYSLRVMLERHDAHTLAVPVAPAPPPAESMPHPEATDRPASDKQATDKPASDKATSDKAASDKSASDKATSDKAASDNAASDKPASDKPASDKPASDKPASDKPASDPPASDQPVTKPSETPPSGSDTGGAP